ncbi:MAG: efflux RND transporter permease subunit, partial [Rhodospirillaceae bacterium]|nr:efflux RND transporter permease subunit [Rhodospirillaceae bacterium]
MQLSDLSVRRPVFVAFMSLSVREYPDTDPPVVSVQTVYTGAAATVVESRITQVLEAQLAGIEGILAISSRSRDGQSEITIEFNPGRDIDSAANDVRDRVSS